MGKDSSLIVKRRLLIFLIFFLYIFSLSAQSVRYQPAFLSIDGVGVNFLGDASFGSLCFESLSEISPTFFFLQRRGIGYNRKDVISPSIISERRHFFILSGTSTGNLGKGNHYFEFGLGGALIIGSSKLDMAYFSVLGYRMHPSFSE